MVSVLTLSSQVARGHVGNSAMHFPLMRLGFQTICLPTILLSNRPDYPATARLEISPASLDSMFAALEGNGWLYSVKAMITGYLPSEEHVAVAASWVARLKQANPLLFYVCDPVIGDDPGGRYISESAAMAIRHQLLPLADAATPNIFELNWLTGRAITSSEDAAKAAGHLGPAIVLASSAPAEGHDRLANILVQPGETWMATVHRRERVPHGTGDFLAAVFTARMLQGHSASEAMSLATASMDALVSASLGADELALTGAQDVWVDPLPWPIHALNTGHAAREHVSMTA